VFTFVCCRLSLHIILAVHVLLIWNREKQFAHLSVMNKVRSLSFLFNNLLFYNTVGRINTVCPHPTMSVTITAGEDRHIRYFDNNSGVLCFCCAFQHMCANVIIGLLIHSTLAHVAGISCLCVDTNGLYALSGCHDGSVRMWEIDRRVCLQVCYCCFNKYMCVLF
jgi:WD40 repeat protein